MHVHLIGVAGTGMGALAGLLQAAGHRVSGSDTAFYPPMGDALLRWGIETKTGFSPANLSPTPDLVIVGNVCRKDNVEARHAIDSGMRVASMPGALEELFLSQRDSFVIAGTHGKTTTTTIVAYLLHALGKDPGLLVGGIPLDFGESFRVGAANAPFVIEGDEYDSAFFEKTPKFWRYAPNAAILTSIEHDHIDIYPDEASYLLAFVEFIKRIPEDGVLIAFAGDANVRRVAKEARCRVVFYALGTDDCGDVSPTWTAAPIAPTGGAQPFDLFVGGTFGCSVFSPLSGDHNVRNALAAIALLCEMSNGTMPVTEPVRALRSFRGVKRRQELRGEARGVRVYDDFAHHPTAVRETLAGLRARHPEGKLIAAFEPRSATACRKLHEAGYQEAFYSADTTILAPLGRMNIPDDERMDLGVVVRGLHAHGLDAHVASSLDDVLVRIANEAHEGDTVVLMSNGDFGNLHARLLAQLAVP